MDISSLYGSSALDSTAYTNAANQTASKLQDKLNSSDYSKATDDELMDACKQFESYFLEQMFKEMMKTIPESEDTSSSNSQLMDYYKDEMVQQIASDSPLALLHQARTMAVEASDTEDKKRERVKISSL